MIFNLAYGLPASGKTTYLKSINGIYVDLDNKSKEYIQSFIESIESEQDVVYNLDLFLFKPEKFISYLKNTHDCVVNIKYINTSRELCLLRDSKRPKNRQSQDLIKNIFLDVN